jgi:hypothetical protein
MADGGPPPGVALDVRDGTTVTVSGLPAAVGDSVLAVEPLRHGLADAATGGIWLVRGPAGSAMFKVARIPNPTEPPKTWRTGDDPAQWNYWRWEFLAYETGLAGAAYAEAASPRLPCSTRKPVPMAA